MSCLRLCEDDADCDVDAADSNVADDQAAGVDDAVDDVVDDEKEADGDITAINSNVSNRVIWIIIKSIIGRIKSTIRMIGKDVA